MTETPEEVGELIALYWDFCELYLGSSLDPSPEAVRMFRQWREATHYVYNLDHLRPEEKKMLREYRRQEAAKDKEQGP